MSPNLYFPLPVSGGLWPVRPWPGALPVLRVLVDDQIVALRPARLDVQDPHPRAGVGAFALAQGLERGGEALAIGGARPLARGDDGGRGDAAGGVDPGQVAARLEAGLEGGEVALVDDRHV